MKRRRNYILIVLIVLTLAFIWIQSLMPQATSAAESGHVLELVRPILELFWGEGNVTSHIVRKLAHFTEFAILGGLLSIYAVWSGCSWRVRTLLALGGGLLAAFLDETIQLFSDGRGSQVQDVWLDFAGVITASAVVYCVAVIVGLMQRNKRTKEKDTR